MEINAREDFGMVWMGGDMLLQNESNDLMMEHSVDSPFFVDSNTQSLTEDEIRCRNQIGMEGFMMLEDLDDSSRWYVNGMPEEMMLDPEQSNSSKVVTTATQTGLQNAPPGSRKIKPVKHPGLKLQTPIAYQRDTDLNVIPIQKDGRAVCKKCGAIGVKHAFYTRERRYCSLACARGSVDGDMSNQEEESPNSNPQWSDEILASQEIQENQQPQTVFLNVNCNPTQYLVQQPNLLESQLPPVFILQSEEPTFHVDKKVSAVGYSYDWTVQLNDVCFTAAEVSCFPRAPMADLWHGVGVGVKVEVENTDMDDFCEEFPNSFWIASVLRVEGYKALLRYEGFINDCSKDFWVNICSSSIHPVGWCAARGKPLIPPNSIKDKYDNWKEFLKKRLTGARTLPSNFSAKVQDSVKSRFRRDLTVEVVDKSRISQVKVATIEKIIGKRLQLRYYDSKPGSPELFWCHEDSPLIHPVGWAKATRQKLDAPPQYHDRVMKGLREKDDATVDLFLTPERTPRLSDYWEKGMKLEAIDPLNLSDICVATVMDVLNDGYLMICVDFWNDQHPTHLDWFCYHMSSPCIFPAGFCAANNIPLTPPKDYDKATFDWNRYLQETGRRAAPEMLFNRVMHNHGFRVGMKLEAADLMNPKLVCVATISRVVGNLLRIQFDGWDKDYDQWLPYDSCDVYPIGWCELVQHKLEPPYGDAKPVVSDHRNGPRKRRGKNHVVYKTIQNVEKTMPFNDEEHSDFQPSMVSTLPSTVIPTGVTVVEEKKSTNLPTWSSNLVVSYTNEESGTFSPANIGSAKHVVKIDLDDVDEGSSGSDINNVDSPCSSVQDSLTEQNNKCMVEKPKVIPRLSDIKTRGSPVTISPDTWDVNDVAEFLKINDCSTYCDAFIKQGIDGNKLLELTKEEVHALVGMKVGPSLKIQNLINQLMSKLNPANSRHSKILKNVL